jgi:hypothetical protein
MTKVQNLKDQFKIDWIIQFELFHFFSFVRYNECVWRHRVQLVKMKDLYVKGLGRHFILFFPSFFLCFFLAYCFLLHTQWMNIGTRYWWSYFLLWQCIDSYVLVFFWLIYFQKLCHFIQVLDWKKKKFQIIKKNSSKILLHNSGFK